MKDKLKDHIDIIFADAPRSTRVVELKEEMLQNLYEKYDDLLAEGKTPSAAYSIAVSGLGDISALIEEMKDDSGYAEGAEARSDGIAHAAPLDEADREAIRRYRNRSAVLTSVSVAMYILCVVPVILAGDHLWGVVSMFVMIAAATCLLIFNSMAKPEVMTSSNGKRSRHRGHDDHPFDDDTPGGRNPVYKAISSVLWIVTVLVYLAISFVFGGWAFTWLIFLIAAAIDNIIKAIFDLRQ